VGEAESENPLVRGYLILAGLAAAIAGVLLVQLSRTAELVAWEVLLVLLLFVLWRVFPSRRRDRVPPLFGRRPKDRPIPPRSVSTFELAAVHAYSESLGADRRLKVLMRRIAGHRLGRAGIKPGTPRAAEVIDPILWAEGLDPLSKAQIERIVEQMENL